MPAFSRALVTIYSPDIARATRFYGEVLGLEQTCPDGAWIQLYHRRGI